MSSAYRTTIIRAGLGAAVKAAAAIGLVACGFSPSGEGGGDGDGGGTGLDAQATTDGGGGDDGAQARPFCDRENPDLRLCMTFEESAMDESGSGIVVDTMEDLGFGPGKVGAAVQLSTSSEIHVTESTALDMTTALTMEAFVFVAQTPANRAGIMDNNGQWGMWVGNNMRPYCTMSGSTVSGPTIATGQWTHIACTFDNLAFRIYVDGALFGTVTRQVPAPTTGVDGVNIGQDCTPTGGNDPLSGALDEVRIWAAPRNDEQIAAAASRTM